MLLNSKICCINIYKIMFEKHFLWFKLNKDETVRKNNVLLIHIEGISKIITFFIQDLNC